MGYFNAMICLLPSVKIYSYNFAFHKLLLDYTSIEKNGTSTVLEQTSAEKLLTVSSASLLQVTCSKPLTFKTVLSFSVADPEGVQGVRMTPPPHRF